MSETTAAAEIGSIIASYGGWKGETLSKIRAAIQQADPVVVEEIKWRKAGRPEGLPVWSHDGMVCFAETWKDNIKLLFPKGASLRDPGKLFNARLESKDIRAVEFREGGIVDAAALELLVREAIAFNEMSTKK